METKLDLNKTISHSIADQKSGLANAAWLPRKKDRIALDAHSFVRGIDRVDQMWPWLKKHYGEVLAVNAPHCNPPDRFNYGELADKISIAASAFLGSKVPLDISPSNNNSFNFL